MNIIKITDILLLSLATWRLTSLLNQEDGPFKMFRKIREMTGITHYKDGKICEIPDKFLCELLSCHWCLSIWVSAAMVFAYIFLPQITIYFALWLSLSTISIVVNDVLLR